MILQKYLVYSSPFNNVWLVCKHTQDSPPLVTFQGSQGLNAAILNFPGTPRSTFQRVPTLSLYIRMFVTVKFPQLFILSLLSASVKGIQNIRSMPTHTQTPPSPPSPPPPPHRDTITHPPTSSPPPPSCSTHTHTHRVCKVERWYVLQHSPIGSLFLFVVNLICFMKDRVCLNGFTYELLHNFPFKSLKLKWT